MARTVVITRQGIPGSAATGYSPGGTDVAVSDGGTGASSAAAARTNLGLGNVDNTSDANKPVSTAQAAALQPIDSDLTAIAALTTTAYGRALLTLANQAALQGALGIMPYANNYGPEPTYLYVCDPGTRSTNISVSTANRTIYLRRITASVPISSIVFGVAVQSGNVCVAAYAHNSGTNGPGAQLASSGSVACPANGEATVSLGSTVSPEWLSISADNTTATFYAQHGGANVLFTASRGRVCYEQAFPAPASASIAGFLSGGVITLVGKP